MCQALGDCLELFREICSRVADQVENSPDVEKLTRISLAGFYSRDSRYKLDLGGHFL